ncbi:MAG: AroM family protein [Anaerolineae bacterium]
MNTLGIVTLGQAPRSDVVPQMRRYLPTGTRILEAGALDGLTVHEVREFRPRPGEYVLTTRMANGESVVVSKERLMPRLRAAFQRVLQHGADTVLLLCTGEFPELSGQALVVEPDRMLRHFVLAFRPQRLGVLIPLPEQVEEARARWSEVTPELAVAPASPYGDPNRIPQAALELLDQEPELIIMDCMGFQEEHRQAVKTVTGAPTVLANAAISRLLAEVLNV